MLTRVDPMIPLLFLAILLASLFPAIGPYRDGAQAISNVAVFLLFFLNGMRLSRRDVAKGIGNWRYLTVLALWSFGALALVGLGFSRGMEGLVPPLVALGFLYLGVLPSTVQSATAYTSMAGGNVAIAVVAAALLNMLGVFVSVPIFSAIGGGAEAELGTGGLAKILLILIVPFALGQALQSRGGQFVNNHPVLIRWMDRAAISIAVYVAFSGAVAQGIWGLLDGASWGWLMGGLIAMLTVAYGGAWLLAGAMRLNRPDRIAFMFGGAQKSVAMGAPLALVLFPTGTAGLILVPLLIYHLLQLVVSAPLANRLRSALD